MHGLIVFSPKSIVDALAWDLLNCVEFQRLRRIKQLGFSELVYPGATHTRFSHSVGVFHTARQLAQIIKHKRPEHFNENAANVAICSALLHDIGHGPFSHTFEGVMNSCGISKSHEDWTIEIIEGDTEVGKLLAAATDKIEDVKSRTSSLLKQEPTDIYSAIVHSQFDADRLDYLRRDKQMTGTEHGGFDWSWLLNNLEIEKLQLASDAGPDEFIPVDGLILGAKSLQAAEAYLLVRFHLYTQVYYHKTTRAAEKMLGRLLSLVAELMRNGKEGDVGLPNSSPLFAFFSKDGATLSNYLQLDDSSIWGGLPLMRDAPNEVVQELSSRLLTRKLYKCVDVGEKLSGHELVSFKSKLSQAKKEGQLSDVDVLIDGPNISPYKAEDYESRHALNNVMIRSSDGGRFGDVSEYSAVVEALKIRRFYRVYVRNETVHTAVEKLLMEVAR
ncbi:MAG: HD domain-containing protein [Candidatus Lambdaproteobacteria bacterium]|nr:HD domain-containing protein [Candidatus Lambdaproteobacteria bacterium]